MTASWFPDIDAQVFISHSHKDVNLALNVAGHLLECFGLSSFIDSTVWGYSDDLLKVLDKKYCYNEGSNTYNYAKRNRSTAHVHMMLSVAITKMMNKCECVIFLNTPQSISAEQYIDGSVTDSPWIYSELAMTDLIGKRLPSVHRVGKSVVATESLASDSRLEIDYEVDLDHLTGLDRKLYMKWVENAKGKTGGQALDVLYNLTNQSC